MNIGFKSLGTGLLIINIIVAILYIKYKNQTIGIIYLICGIIAIFLLAFALQDHEDSKKSEKENWGDHL